jgi:hypothetical protein
VREEKGGYPTRRMYIMTPVAHTSTLTPYPVSARISVEIKIFFRETGRI